MNFLINLKFTCDLPKLKDILFQDPASASMELIINFHNDLFFFLIIIAVLVFYYLLHIFRYCYDYEYDWHWYLFDRYTKEKIELPLDPNLLYFKKVFGSLRKDFKYKYVANSVNHSIFLEWLFAGLPILFLISICIPSVAILYQMDDALITYLTIKVTGKQWFWNYSYDLNFKGKRKVSVIKNLINNSSSLEKTRSVRGFVPNSDLKKDYFLYSDILDRETYLKKIDSELLNVNVKVDRQVILRSLSKDFVNKSFFSFLDKKEFLVDKKKGIYDFVLLLFLFNDLKITPNENLKGFLRLNFESRLVAEKDLLLGEPRLLTVDKPLNIPGGVNLRFLFTSTDVLHSWAVPSFGVKVDCCPGRLNVTEFMVNRFGSFYGQCSEICGVNHAFMPINVRALNYNDFFSFISKNLSYKVLEKKSYLTAEKGGIPVERTISRFQEVLFVGRSIFCLPIYNTSIFYILNALLILKDTYQYFCLDPTWSMQDKMIYLLDSIIKCFAIEIEKEHRAIIERNLAQIEKEKRAIIERNLAEIEKEQLSAFKASLRQKYTLQDVSVTCEEFKYFCNYLKRKKNSSLLNIKNETPTLSKEDKLKETTN